MKQKLMDTSNPKNQIAQCGTYHSLQMKDLSLFVFGYKKIN